MTNYNVGSIADFAWQRIDSVPSAISGAVMVGMATTSIFELENFTGTSIGTTAFDQKYVPYLVDMTTALTLGRMNGVGVDAANFRLGDLSIDKRQSPAIAQMEMHLKNAQQALIAIGRPNKVYASFYG